MEHASWIKALISLSKGATNIVQGLAANTVLTLAIEFPRIRRP